MDHTIRLLPSAAATGAVNMAADEIMLRTAGGGTASLRFYGWTEATLSLGYFQSFYARQSESRLQALPWLRRPSGGGAIVHHHELTYALALPGGCGPMPLRTWLPRMHRIIIAALTELGAREIALIEGPAVCHGNVLCFQQHTPGDVVCRGQKIVGSAQRKYQHALLQHGSILLARSEFAPQLSGVCELLGVALNLKTVEDAVVRAFRADTGWRIEEADWTAAEKAAIGALAVERYASREWNERR